jgi:hypothetical protein
LVIELALRRLAAVWLTRFLARARFGRFSSRPLSRFVLAPDCFVASKGEQVNAGALQNRKVDVEKHRYSLETFAANRYGCPRSGKKLVTTG